MIRKYGTTIMVSLLLLFFSVSLFSRVALSRDLKEIKAAGVLRHLGVPYAHFVNGNNAGLDVEMMQLFAEELGVRYEYVETSWKDVISDLIGQNIIVKSGKVKLLDKIPLRGDIIANGLTVLDWRKQVVAFSEPNFPTQIWLLAQAQSSLKPIKPSGDIEQDIKQVKSLLKGHSIMGKSNTCLEPELYGVADDGAHVVLFPGSVNDLAPAVIQGEAEATILDVPDSLIALDKWPGQVKVIGPLSRPQVMACGFRPASVELRQAYNSFLQNCRQQGIYRKLVKKYYPTVFLYYADFFTTDVN